jgi:hypothetical protein
MTHHRLLEVARLRGLISRLRRQYGNAEALELLQRAIESELPQKDNIPSK